MSQLNIGFVFFCMGRGPSSRTSVQMQASSPSEGWP